MTKKELMIYSDVDDCMRPFKLTLKDILVDKGELHLVCTDGTIFCIEDNEIIGKGRGVRPLFTKDVFRNYKGSILNEVFNNVFFQDMTGKFYGWTGKVKMYSTESISECIHDGIHTFFVMEHAIKYIQRAA